MTNFTIASFNVKNLIVEDKKYYKFQKYTPEEYAWKADWLSEQLQTMNAYIVGFQEIFEESAQRDLIAEANAEGIEDKAAHIPNKTKRYRKRAIFRKLAYTPYTNAALAFAPNLNDGGAGERRPGFAILLRFGFVGEPEVIQDLDEDQIKWTGKSQEGSYVLKRLYRAILKVRVPVIDAIITIFNCHLKSKLGEYDVPEGAEFPAEAVLTEYDPVGRAMGAMRASMRRIAEACVLRRLIVEELHAGNPVMVMGDFNDGEHAISSGEAPFKNYSWMLRHNAKASNDRYSKEQNIQITEDIKCVRLHSAEKQFVRKSARDIVFTMAFGGNFESIDQIYMSRHFMAGTPNSIGEMEYFSVLNDHLTDGSHPEAPYNKLASDHGQIIAHMRLNDRNKRG